MQSLFHHISYFRRSESLAEGSKFCSTSRAMRQVLQHCDSHFMVSFFFSHAMIPRDFCICKVSPVIKETICALRACMRQLICQFRNCTVWK